jgi:hypothetical protein
MVNFLDFKTLSAMLPPFRVPIHISQYDIESTKRIGDIILASEESILSIPVPEINAKASWGSNYTQRPDNWITARLPYYNFLDREEPEIQLFKKFIYESYLEYQKGLDNPIPSIYVHGWVNIVRNNEQITAHNHANAHVAASEDHSYISGNFCVRADNTSTNYRSPYLHNTWKSVPNVAGDLVLFPSFVFHNTSMNQAIEPRLSLAFDIITEEVYNTLPDNFKKIFCRLEPY